MEDTIESSVETTPTSSVETATPEAPKAPEVKMSPETRALKETFENAKKGIFPEKKDPKVKENPLKNETLTAKDPVKGTDSPVIPVIPEKPAYTPNLKFKVDGQEYEFDPELKDLVKTPEVEKKLRDLYANAHGIKYVQQRADKISNDFHEVSNKYNSLDKDLRLLSHHVNNGDFDSFFGDLKIPKEKIFQWVEQKLAEINMDPNQQARLEQQRQMQRNSFLVQEENQNYKTQIQQHAVQARTYELDMELIKPEVSQIAQDFDARVGRVGAFREECMNRGALAWQFAKKDITAAEAVQQAMSILGKVLTPLQTTQALQTPAQAQPQAQQHAQPPIIPNIAGRSTSPVKQSPKNVADLRRMAKQMTATS